MSLGLIAFGEDIGQSMAKRSLNHLISSQDTQLKRAVPLAFSMLAITKPDNQIMDLLSKLAYDQDEETAANSILALGIIWSGTNNSRLANQLRNLASYYNKDPNQLFMIRVAQGLSHMGKGLINIQPIHSDQMLQNNVGLGGLFTLLLTCTDLKTLFFGRFHTMLYYLVLPMYPRMLVTVSSNFLIFIDGRIP